MRLRNAEAARLETDYLARVRTALAGRDASEVEEVIQSVKEHIEEELSHELDGEISLVQMAAVLERLGPPETYADENEPSSLEDGATDGRRSASPLGDLARQNDYSSLLGALWWGFLINVVGLFVPVIDFAFCSLIGYAIIAYAILTRRGRCPDEMKPVGGMAIVIMAMIILAAPLRLQNLSEPMVGFLTLPLTILLWVVPLLVYWKVMGGVASMLQELPDRGLASQTLKTRQTYIFVAIAMFVVSWIVGVVVAAAFVGRWGVHGRELMAIAQASAVAKLLLLPIRWGIGWYFVLKPIGKARDVLAANAA